jgi:hypothetical protein
MVDKNKLYTTQQAAAMLGFTDGRLRQLIIAGTAQPAQQIGGTWVFTLEEIERVRQRPKRTKKQ